MDKYIKAKITWLNRSEGVALPNDRCYFVVKVKPFPLKVNGSVWSLVVENTDFLTENETIASIKYLVKEAPDNLCEGVEIELYVGNVLVAEGVVL